MSGFERVWYPIVLRELEVLRIRDVTPTMRRITVGGPQLGAFHRGGRDLTSFHTGGFDDHVKLFFPAPGETEPVLPEQDDGHLDWPKQAPRPVHRDYTVRRYAAATGVVDLDVVTHPGGVASDWALAVDVGARIHLAGPKMSELAPPAQRYLLVGDETALPAIARYAEELAPGVDARAVVEIADAGERQDLPWSFPRWARWPGWLARLARCAGSGCTSPGTAASTHPGCTPPATGGVARPGISR